MILTLLLGCQDPAQPLPVDAVAPPPALSWTDSIADRPLPGGELRLGVRGGVPGRPLLLLASTTGAQPDGACVATGCVDLIQPTVLRRFTAPPAGATATLRIDVPATVAPGTTLWLQAVQLGAQVATTPVRHTTVTGPCPVDAGEPDDDDASATPMVHGDLITGRSACSDDDLFVTTARAGDLVRWTVRSDRFDDPVASLLHGARSARRGAWDEITHEVLVDVDTELTLHIFPTSPGMVAGPTVGAPYAVELEVTPTGVPPCVDDPTEPADVTAVVGQPVQGALCATDDVDAVAFPVVGGQWYEVEATWDPSTSDLDLSSFDVGAYEYGAAMYYVAAETPGRAIVRFQAESSGTEVARLTSTVPSLTHTSHPWTLVVREVPGLEACVDDASEPNDTVGTAAPAGGADLALCPNSPVDVYAVPTLGPARIDVDSAPRGGDISDLSARVLDASGAPFACASGCALPASIGVPAAGAWFVELTLRGVSPQGEEAHWSPWERGIDAGMRHDLMITATPPSPCPVDPFEPNDDPLTAPIVTVGQRTTGHALCDNDEVDHFSVWLAAGEEVVVDAGVTRPIWIGFRLTGPGGEDLHPNGAEAAALGQTRVRAWQDGWHDLALQLPDRPNLVGWVSDPVTYDLEVLVTP